MFLRLFSTYLLLCLSVGGGLLRAQTLPVISTFLENNPTYAVTAVGLGDVNGDGSDDYALSLFHQVMSIPFAFTVDAVIVSGADGALIADYQPSAFPAIPVASVYPCGDLDGDSHAEFLTLERGQSGPASIDISVRSGALLTPLYTINYGALANVDVLSSTALGDLDGDGIREIGLATRRIVSVTAGLGQIEVLSGATGAVLFSLGSPTLQSNGIGDLGDLDGDGVSDFFVSRTNGADLIFGPLNAGMIEIYSGATLSVLSTINASHSTQALGYRACAVSDLDGDGNPDILSLSIDAGLAAGQSALYEAYSSGSGSLIWSVPSPTNTNVFDLRSAGDINGDGIDEFVTSLAAVGASFSFRELRSGADGSILEILPASLGIAGANSGPLRSDAFVGDLNGDGIADRLEHQVTPTASVQATAHATLAAQVYGASPGTSLALRFDAFAAQPRLGNYEISGASPFASLLVAASLAPATATITGTAFPLLVSLNFSNLILTVNLVADAFGVFRSPVSLSLPALAGTVIYLQVAETTPIPAVSNGLEVLFGN
ncbi:MAG: VCBS repeat-containing protein [Planctomycetota bacterium]